MNDPDPHADGAEVLAAMAEAGLNPEPTDILIIPPEGEDSVAQPAYFPTGEKKADS